MYRKLRHFARQFWQVADPKTKRVIWNPHLDILCDEVQALLEESLRRRTMDPDEAAALPPLRLVINVPPRSAKSTILQKLALAWWWLRVPGEQILALANNETLIERDGSALRRVVVRTADSRLAPRQQEWGGEREGMRSDWLLHWLVLWRVCLK